MIFLLKSPMLNRVLAQAALAAAKPWESGTGSLRWCSTMLHKPVAVSQCLAGQISGFLSSMDYQNIHHGLSKHTPASSCSRLLFKQIPIHGHGAWDALCTHTTVGSSTNKQVQKCARLGRHCSSVQSSSEACMININITKKKWQMGIYSTQLGSLGRRQASWTAV